MSSVNLNTSFLFHQGSRSRSPTFHLFHTLTKLPISSITTKKPQKGNRFFPFPSFSVSVVLTKEEVLKGKEENKESEKPAFNFKSYMVNRARNFDNLPSLRHFEDLMVTPLALTVCHGGSAGAVTEGAPELLPKEKDSEGGEGGNKQGQQGKASEGEERASESPCKAESQRGMMKSSDKPPKGSNSGTLAAESPVVNNRSDELQGSPATPNMDVKAESKNFSQELQQLREYCMNQKSIDSMFLMVTAGGSMARSK
ncbi:uncharacterized protein [Arachis hypogaea]|uniref:uncharacterized protein isoform X12 n=1 Tax=Arachis hypogaea TaxID=3818 RepID=UPI003B2138C1